MLGPEIDQAAGGGESDSSKLPQDAKGGAVDEGRSKKGGGARYRKRPTQLSMDVIEGSIRRSPASSIATFRMVSEKLVTSVVLASGHKSPQGSNSRSNNSNVEPSTRLRGSTGANSTPGSLRSVNAQSASVVRVSSPLCMEVDPRIAKPRTPSSSRRKTPVPPSPLAIPTPAAPPLTAKALSTLAGVTTDTGSRKGSPVSESEFEELSLDASNNSQQGGKKESTSVEGKETTAGEEEGEEGRNRGTPTNWSGLVGKMHAIGKKALESAGEDVRAFSPRGFRSMKMKTAESGAAATAAGGGRGNESAPSSVSAASVFRPLSPLLLPALRSPRMKFVVGAEKLEKVLKALEENPDDVNGSDRVDAEGRISPFWTSAEALEAIKAVREPLASLAKQIRASVQSPAGEDSSTGRSTRPQAATTPLGTTSMPSTLPPPPPPLPSVGMTTTIVAPTAIRPDVSLVGVFAPMESSPPLMSSISLSPEQPQQHQLSSSSMLPPNPSDVLAPPMFLSYPSVKANQQQHRSLHSVSDTKASRGTSSSSSSSSKASSTTITFAKLLGLGLFGAGACQAAIQFYTMYLGSDYNTWWAGITSFILGSLTLVPKQQRKHLHGFQLIYNALAIGSIGAGAAALVFDAQLLDILTKTEFCGDAGDSLMLGRGTVLPQTMGGACALASGCACVSYLNPLAAAGPAVQCTNFPFAAANACSGLNHVVSGMIRVSISVTGAMILLTSILAFHYGSRHYGHPSSSYLQHAGSTGTGGGAAASRSWGKIVALSDPHQRQQQQHGQDQQDDVEGAMTASLDVSRSRGRGILLMTPIPENAIPHRPPGEMLEEDGEEGEEEEGEFDGPMLDGSSNAGTVHVY